MSIRHPTDLTLAMARNLEPPLSFSQKRDTEDERKPNTKDAKKLALDSLPSDILLTIFDVLPRVSSVCLGLTCSALYSLHRAKYGTVKLTNIIQFGRRHIRLAELLRDFFPGLMFYPKLRKYVSVSKYHCLTLKDLREHRRLIGLCQIDRAEEEEKGWLLD
ncbi:hypothetical protein BDZ45DRAFT_697826 [Acephala macrosclerotiorum]|nr:hypothetical protein BDZ45DRAFT_697826 [Acephala macrosclerotiorum]